MLPTNCTKSNHLLQAEVVQATQGPGQDLKLPNSGHQCPNTLAPPEGHGQTLELPNSGHQCPNTLATHGCPEEQPSPPGQYPRQGHSCPKQDSRLHQDNTGPEGLCSERQQSPQPRLPTSSMISRPRQDDIALPVPYRGQ